MTLFVRGQCHHDGRLDQRDQSHVGVCGDRDGCHQFRCQVVRAVDGGRAVSAADDADSSCLLRGEKADGVRKHECAVDAQLCSSAQAQGDRVRDQRTEVRHGADSQEHHAGEEAGLNAHVHNAEDSGFIPVLHLSVVEVVEGPGIRQVGHEDAVSDRQ